MLALRPPHAPTSPLRINITLHVSILAYFWSHKSSHCRDRIKPGTHSTLRTDIADDITNYYLSMYLSSIY